jgi:ribosomal protein S17E
MNNTSKNELIDEYNKNSKIEDELLSRIQILKENNLEDKLTFIFGSTVVLMGITTMILFFTNSIEAVGTILSSFNIDTISFGSVFGFALLSEGLRRLTYKLHKTKDKLKSFSKAKNEKERIDEEVRYRIVKEEIILKSKAIEQAMDMEKPIVEIPPVEYDTNVKKELTEKDIANITINGLNKRLDEKYKELHVVATKKVLHERFNDVRNLSERWDKYFQTVGISSVSSGIFVLPHMMFEDYAKAATSAWGAVIFTFSGCIFGNIYHFVTTRIAKKIFKKYNDELGDKALSNKRKDRKVELDKINSERNKLLNEISSLIFKIEEEKEFVRNYDNEHLSNNQDALEIVKVRHSGMNKDYQEDVTYEEKGVVKSLKM